MAAGNTINNTMVIVRTGAWAMATASILTPPRSCRSSSSHTVWGWEWRRECRYRGLVSHSTIPMFLLWLLPEGNGRSQVSCACSVHPPRKQAATESASRVPESKYRHIPPGAQRGPPILSSLVCKGGRTPHASSRRPEVVCPTPQPHCSRFDRRVHPVASSHLGLSTFT